MAEQDPPLSSKDALVRELTRVQRLHEERRGNPILAGALERLADWQARRLRMTYADLAADPRYTAAIQFFQNDLYGSADYSRRDADLVRVVPVMVKMLPDGVVATAASAVELNALSQELDRVLLARLPRADGNFTVAEYCKAYRRAGNFPLRRRQIRLIGEAGHGFTIDLVGLLPELEVAQQLRFGHQLESSVFRAAFRLAAQQGPGLRHLALAGQQRRAPHLCRHDVVGVFNAVQPGIGGGEILPFLGDLRHHQIGLREAAG